MGSETKVSRAPETSGAHIWVVEDDRLIRSSLDFSLRAEGFQVRADDDGRAVKEVVSEFRPDLAILDVRLPVGPDGCAIARALRDISDLGVLFLTAADSIEERIAGFHAGADDYLVKPFSMAELMVRVQALLRRTGRAGSMQHEVGDLVIDDAARVVTRAGVTLELTKREYELLLALAGRTGQVMTKLQLLAQVWRFEASDPNLVEVHVSSLRRKLEAEGPRMLHTVRGVGYRLQA